MLQMEYSLNIPKKILDFHLQIFEKSSFEIFNILQIIYKINCQYDY
jgi:flagellar assembly factor FliW